MIGGLFDRAELKMHKPRAAVGPDLVEFRALRRGLTAMAQASSLPIANRIAPERTLFSLATITRSPGLTLQLAQIASGSLDGVRELPVAPRTSVASTNAG